MITLGRIERLFSDHQHARLYRELVSARPEATFGLERELSRVVPLAALGMIRLDELSQSQTQLFQRLLNVVLTSQKPDGSWGDPITTAVALRALLINAGHGPAVENALAYLARTQSDAGLWGQASPDVSKCLKMYGNVTVSEKARNEPTDPLRRLPRPWRPALPLSECPEVSRQAIGSRTEKAQNEPTAGRSRLTSDRTNTLENSSAGTRRSDAFISAFLLLQLGDHQSFRRAVRFDDAVAHLTHQANRLDANDRRVWNHAAPRCRTSPFTREQGRFLWPAA